MAGIRAADVQYILNNTVSPGWLANVHKTSYIADLVGLKRGKAKIQNTAFKSGNVSAKAYGEGDTISDVVGKRGRVLVEQVYKRIVAGFGIEGMQEALNAIGGHINVNDLLAQEAVGATQSIMNEIDLQVLNSHIGSYNYSSSKEITPLLHILSNSTSFATAEGALIDRSAAGNEWWTPLVVAADDAISVAILREMKYQFTNRRKRHWKQIWTSHETKDDLVDLMTNRISYVNMKIIGIDHEVPMFDNTPIIAIPGFPDDIAFVDPADWSLEYVPQKTSSALGKTEGIFKVKEFPQDTDDDQWGVLVYMNLVCRNPYNQGIITGVTTGFTIDVDVSDGEETGTYDTSVDAVYIKFNIPLDITKNNLDVENGTVDVSAYTLTRMTDYIYRIVPTSSFSTGDTININVTKDGYTFDTGEDVAITV